MQLQDQLAALDKRLADLEAKVPAGISAQSGSSAPPAASDPAAAGSVQDSTHDQARTNADTTSTPVPGASLDPADLQDVKKQLADVAAAQKGLHQQVSALEDSKADRADVREMLSEGLRAKADSAAVNQLKTQLGDKADRSELDALLNAMTNSTSPGNSSVDEHGSNSNTSADPGAGAAADAASTGSTQEAQAGSMPSSSASVTAADGFYVRLGAGGSRRGTKEREAGGDLAQQLSKLQLQLALLQDRVNKKVGHPACYTAHMHATRAMTVSVDVHLHGLTDTLSCLGLLGAWNLSHAKQARGHAHVWLNVWLGHTLPGASTCCSWL